MNDVEKLKALLKQAYSRIPERAKGSTRAIDIDPAGNTYEFIEHEWSKEIRAVLGIDYEPTGV